MICKKCLLSKMSEEAFQNVKEYIQLIPKEKKTEETLYRKRLEACEQCDCLINGMCSKCGCFAEVRAAYKHNRCPHENRLW